MTAALAAPAESALTLPGVSIVLPCHDEAPNVAEAVRTASAAGLRYAHAHEVIVVDDGSSDETRAIATRMAAADPAVRVVVHPHNLGYGAALRSGIAAARQPWVLLTDADLQFDLDQLGDFVPFADDRDVLVGYRIERQDPRGRIIAAAGWNRLVRLAFRLPVRDVDCAFKLLRRDALQRIGPLGSDGAVISTELLAKARRAGIPIAEVPVSHYPRLAGSPTGASPRVIIKAFRELVHLRAAIAHDERPHPGTP
jgi:glycosyltransferase involved in cell wall biosynthesis